MHNAYYLKDLCGFVESKELKHVRNLTHRNIEVSEMQTSSPRNLINSRDLKARLGGVTDMTLWRWQRRADLEFPRPVIIAKRKYWDAADVDAFIARQERAA